MGTHKFYCSHCKQNKSHKSDSTTGYASKRNGHKVCFECCAVVDKQYMDKYGKINLCLTLNPKALGLCQPHMHHVSNWPGTLKFSLVQHSKGRHNIAGSRNDVWFHDAHGRTWHGVQYGEWTQVVHCKRLKTA